MFIPVPKYSGNNPFFKSEVLKAGGNLPQGSFMAGGYYIYIQYTVLDH